MLLQGNVLATYNFAEVALDGEFGDYSFIPGALNQPLYTRPVDFHHDEDHHNFSPAGEVRAASRYRISKSVSVHLNWSALMVGNVIFAEDRVAYRLPDLGLQDADSQTYFVQQVFCGIELLR